MKALLVNPVSQLIEEIEIHSRDDVVSRIGFDTVIADEVGPEGDCLYFDEDCFLRGTAGRFQIDNIVPVAGTGVVTGAIDKNHAFSDVKSSIESLTARIKYL
tara:strand:+ start:1260 stop:1565 length:306 start_codon:yes stop_codon:yes gene_type:complete